LAVEQAGQQPRTRTYPHIGSFDDAARQAIRILYDQIFTLQERLTAAEQTITNLVTAANTLESQQTTLQQQVNHALAPTQEV